MPVNGYSIDLCYLFLEKSSIDPRGKRRTCYPMHVFYPYAMIWLPVFPSVLYVRYGRDTFLRNRLAAFFSLASPISPGN